MLVLARFRQDPGFLGGFLETAQRALDGLPGSNAYFQFLQPPFTPAPEGARKFRGPGGPQLLTLAQATAPRQTRRD